MMLWAWAGVPLGVYNFVEDFNIALRIQPQLLAALSLTTWVQCYYYEKYWSITQALAVILPLASVMGGIEAGLVIALRIARDRGFRWPITIMAALSATLLAAGVLRHYWDIWRHRTVRGISFLFVGIDAMGDLTSLISVLFQPPVDILGLVIYGTELALWSGVFIAGGYYNLVPWLKRKRKDRTLTRFAQEELSRRDADAVQARQFTIHDMPSSTSVFRTPSELDSAVRMRAQTAN
ncbi:MAG: hypothetical protein M1820_009691 [Bogoriella megaspora]|nr:MAG: hypothetical protein M1820_009691 [Bogoriella megaspora]